MTTKEKENLIIYGGFDTRASEQIKKWAKWYAHKSNKETWIEQQEQEKENNY